MRIGIYRGKILEIISSVYILRAFFLDGLGAI
jgi:hypothetical protein